MRPTVAGWGDAGGHGLQPKTVSTDMPVDMRRRHISTMLLLGAITVPQLTVAAQPLAPSFRITDFNWMDTARSRPVPARLYWPEIYKSEGAVPLVVFSHGIGGSRQGYSYLGKHWSSQGVASLHVQHVGSDVALWKGNPFGVISRLQSAAQESEAIARASDITFALDRMLSDEPGSNGARVDRTRIVAAGHSYGANTTLLTIGASVVRRGQVIDCLDPRFTAAVIISAPPFYGEHDLTSILRQISVPTLHITATDDVIEIPGYHSGVADRLAVYDSIPNHHKLLAVFQGGSHSIFTDRPLTGGLAHNPKVKAATADLALAFLDLAFEGESSTLAGWNTTWKDILARAPTNNFASESKITSSNRLPYGISAGKASAMQIQVV